MLENFLMMMPKYVRKSFFVFLAAFSYHLSSRYRKVGFTNLDFIFGERLSQKEKKEIVKYSFKNLLLNFLHLMEIRHMSKEDLANIVTIKNMEAVQKVHDEGRAVIYVTPHYCAWELGGASIGAFAEPIAAVYKKMKNKEYEKWTLESRERFGNSSLEKSNVVRPLIKLIKNRGGSGILIDTGINKKDGLKVEFMGKFVHQTSTPAYLARKFNAAIIPVIMTTDDEENYTLEFFDEIPVQHTEDEQTDILNATQLQADWLTKLITDEPKFWFWIHRRFKSDYPEIYKN